AGEDIRFKKPPREPAPEPRSPTLKSLSKWLLKPYILPCRALCQRFMHGGGILGGSAGAGAAANPRPYLYNPSHGYGCLRAVPHADKASIGIVMVKITSVSISFLKFLFIFPPLILKSVIYNNIINILCQLTY
ncbi:MAG: hypothetical protein FWC64_10040, partial [Treponema sp.]|nr:hypothetical protein [Treponema sp.]